MMRTAGFGFSLTTALTVSAVTFVCYELQFDLARDVGREFVPRQLFPSILY
jgi:hypothetical protein